MIGISLKSQKAATYIDQIMGLEEEAQEFLGAIVEDCLGSIEEDTSGRGRSRQAAPSNDSSRVKKSDIDSDDEEKKNQNPLQQLSMSSYGSVDQD